MLKLKRFIEFLKVVVNNFRPIANELIRARIARARLIFMMESRLRMILIFLNLIAFAIVLVLSFLVLQRTNGFERKSLAFKNGSRFKVVGLEAVKIKDDKLVDDLMKRLDQIIVEANKGQGQVLIVKKEIKKKSRSKKIVKPFWRMFLKIDNKIFDVETIIFFKKELAKMRYQCSANWNRRVDVLCSMDDPFCQVSFKVVLDEQKYKAVFRSEIFASGFDKVSKIRVYFWGQENLEIDDEIKKDLVKKIIKARPVCSPFCTK